MEDSRSDCKQWGHVAGGYSPQVQLLSKLAATGTSDGWGDWQRPATCFTCLPPP